MVEIRSAVIDDLDGIMTVEKETFESIAQNAAAERELMEHRINLCNSGHPKWFWVAEVYGKVVGYIILQPTYLEPKDCSSWSVSTGNGLLSHFNPRGRNIFVVSLGFDESVPGTADLLAHKAFVLWLKTRKKYFMFCSRMPGYKNALGKSGTRPETYWRLRRKDGSPKDWMLREYHSMTGVRPYKLLLNGWLADEDSGGHSVLFVSDRPILAIQNIAVRIHRAPSPLTKKESKEVENETENTDR